MQNISDVVDKYGGWKSINIDENIFEVQIVLYLWKKSHGVCYGIFNADFDENQTNFNMQKE